MHSAVRESIDTTGLTVAAVGGLAVFTNSMGAMVWNLLGFDTEFSTPEDAPLDPALYLFTYYRELCMVMVVVGILLLIGGLFLRRYKRWANYLVTGFSALLLLALWGAIIAVVFALQPREELAFFRAGVPLVGVVLSIPLAWLIWFLNKRDVKGQFS